ncbi:alpha/beta hydrolase family protein [Agromyces atrinae]|uniref:Alpha/beta fold hydrolase n=1 Tax=Agromyces atrinae TaxID=592376 RepID=A0A4Q2M7C7_9MICO|nr:alpha/beta fold hydrolase [Agromyces atrinae]NYD67654.1 putative dienelactone hydrolase [Agromyces atrinae]RXZ88144.1 alpha/beta fold hydrolase [Agromyces atrinae]
MLIANDADVVIEGLAGQYGLPRWLFSELADARGRATPSATFHAGSFPVVLFSPGLGSSRWLASTWATELASHGAIVVALDHPFDAAATRILDGAIAMSGLVATGDATEDNRNAASWTETRAKDLSALLDALVAAKQHNPVLAGADMDRVVVVGHSLGGAAALLAGGTDLRVDGVADIDGMPRFSGE